MAEIISRDDQQALLQAVREGRVPPDQGPRRSAVARDYDFRRPHRLSIEQMRTFQAIHNHAAELMAISFARIAGAEVTVTVGEVEEISYRLFQDSAPELLYAVVLDVSPLEDPGLMLCDVPLCQRLIDRLLGGQGAPIDNPRPLTAIDQAVVEIQIEQMLRALGESWAQLLNLKFGVTDRRNEIKMLQLIPYSETMLHVPFVVKGAMGEGRFDLGLPLRSIKTKTDILLQKTPARRGPETNDLRERLRQTLADVPLPVSATLATLELPLRNLISIQEGATIRIGESAEPTVTVCVDGKPLFHGKAGLHGRRKAVQLQEKIQDK